MRLQGGKRFWRREFTQPRGNIRVCAACSIISVFNTVERDGGEVGGGDWGGGLRDGDGGLGGGGDGGSAR
jgi:hypothetical protein